MTQNHIAEQAEAAALEGILEVAHNPQVVAQVTKYQVNRDTKSDAEGKRKDASAALLEAFALLDSIAFTINGEVVARKQETDVASVDQKKLKEDYPEAYAACVKSTHYVKVWVAPSAG